jgi:hypothetical protein
MSVATRSRIAVLPTKLNPLTHHGIALQMACTVVLALLPILSINASEEFDWTVLSENLDCFQDPKDGWSIRGNVKLDGDNPSELASQPGRGILVGTRKGKNLITKETYRDCQIEFEFMIPQGSNSGIKLAGCYEVQIRDSWNKDRVSGDDCGGIYPRAEENTPEQRARLNSRWRLVDDGIPPKKNACRKPGEWQTLKIVFHSPRFDPSGKKIANAKFILVELNGVVIHENQEIAHPTGHAPLNKERDCGPLFLQGDHGPVAFRNVRIKAL